MSKLLKKDVKKFKTNRSVFFLVSIIAMMVNTSVSYGVDYFDDNGYKITAPATVPKITWQGGGKNPTEEGNISVTFSNGTQSEKLKETTVQFRLNKDIKGLESLEVGKVKVDKNGIDLNNQELKNVKKGSIKEEWLDEGLKNKVKTAETNSTQAKEESAQAKKTAEEAQAKATDAEGKANTAEQTANAAKELATKSEQESKKASKEASDSAQSAKKFRKIS